MKTSVPPARSTAAMTSSSRFEPPGSMITRTPASSAACDAVGEREEGVGREHRARDGASAPCRARAASSRRGDIWPAPIPTVAVSRAITMAFERTCLTTRQANRRSPHSRSVGARAGHDLHRVAILGLGVAILDQEAAEHLVGSRARRASGGGARPTPAGAGCAACRAAGRRRPRRSPARAAPRRTARRRARRASRESGRLSADDAAERRRRVGRERLAVGLLRRRRERARRRGCRA